MRRRSTFRGLASINITSLVDVTLCLLIIFMLTAPYIQGGVEVNLPAADTRTQLVREGPVISITANRQVFFQEDAISLDDLIERLAPYLPDRETIPVYLRADEEIPYGFALQVMAVIERAGFVNLSLVAEPEH
ncbi:MAG: biopolymer transporter ExbD [Candidatus Krumholzibacteria bacterium]|jgi:biopolymer transport protein TolR|nr:biopolymer transporter ExbD [Candidatus Krumholzibacteria bacterium]